MSIPRYDRGFGNLDGWLHRLKMNETISKLSFGRLRLELNRLSTKVILGEWLFGR